MLLIVAGGLVRVVHGIQAGLPDAIFADGILTNKEQVLASCGGRHTLHGMRVTT